MATPTLPAPPRLLPCCGGLGGEWPDHLQDCPAANRRPAQAVAA